MLYNIYDAADFSGQRWVCCLTTRATSPNSQILETIWIKVLDDIEVLNICESVLCNIWAKNSVWDTTTVFNFYLIQG